MPAIVGYARVSTSDQDIAGQKHELQAAGACRALNTLSRNPGARLCLNA